MTTKKIGRPAERPEIGPQQRVKDFGPDNIITDPFGQEHYVVRDANGVGILLDDLPLAVACWRHNRGEKGVLERELGISDDGGDLALVSMANLVFWRSELLDAKLSIYTRGVYTDLAMRDNRKEGAHAFVGVRKIAATCGISQKIVIRSIKELEAAGLIEVQRQSRKRSHYRVRSLEEWQAWKVKTVPAHGTDSSETALPREADLQQINEKLHYHGKQAALPREADLHYHGKRKDIPKRSHKEIGSANAPPSSLFFSDSASQKKPPKKPVRKFDRLPPLSEIIEFCAESGLPKSDAEYFHDHWAANGFRNGTHRIKDWHALIRSWNRAGYLPSQKQNQNPSKDIKL